MYNPSFKGDVCSHKHSFMLDNLIRKLFQNPARITGPYIKAGDTVVDIGCGPGFFSVEMAKLVGSQGRVLAVDLQEEMLGKLSHKAVLSGLTDIIQPVLCTQERLNIPASIKADFILAYYMVHETLDKERFFTQVKEVLAPGGRLLVVEPPFHVSKKTFARIEARAIDAGFRILDRPKRKGGMSLLLTV